MLTRRKSHKKNDYFCISADKHNLIQFENIPHLTMNITYISKENSLMLKGLALLFMVILHLYNTPENLQDAFSLCAVQGMPLASWIAQGCNPVGLYLFMSGYGLYFTHNANSHRGGVFKNY